MFFTRYLMDTPFDEEGIKKLHERLLKYFPDAVLSWKDGKCYEENPLDADSAEIKIGDKAFFSISRRNDKAVFKFSVMKEQKEDAVRAIKASGLGHDLSEMTKPVSLAVLYLLIFCFLVAFYEHRVFIPVLLVCFGILVTESVAYLVSLYKNLDNSYLRISSVVSIIGLIPLAPASMLLFPLMMAMNKRALYKLMDEVE